MVYLPHKTLSNDAQKVHIFPTLTNASLLFLGQLCEDDFIITLDNTNLTITKYNNTIIQGERNNNDGLLDINLTSLTWIKIPTFSPKFQHVHNTTTIVHTANITVQRQSHKISSSITIDALFHQSNLHEYKLVKR